jgi:hypothetical protein
MPWIYADVRDRAESDFEFKLIFQAAVLITNNTVSPLSLWERVRVRGRFIWHPADLITPQTTSPRLNDHSHAERGNDPPFTAAWPTP